LRRGQSYAPLHNLATALLWRPRPALQPGSVRQL